MDWHNTKAGRYVKKPTFGDLLDFNDVVGRKNPPLKKAKYLKNKEKNYGIKDLGYNKTIMYLRTGAYKIIEGKRYPITSMKILGGFINIKTLLKKWGKDAILEVFYEDTRTERCSKLVKLG